MNSKLFNKKCKNIKNSKPLKTSSLLLFFALLISVALTAQTTRTAQEDFFNSSAVHVATVQQADINLLKPFQKKPTYLDNNVFYADEYIYIAKDGLFTIKTKRIELNETVLGLGELRIAAIDTITLAVKEPLEIAHITVANTVLSLDTPLEVKGKMVLDNAQIQLNEYDLVTEQSILFKNNSKIIENKTGVWISKEQYKQPLLPIQGANTVSKLAAPNGYDNDYTIYSVVAKSKLKKPNSKQSFYKKIKLEIPKPPPKHTTSC